MKNKKSLLYIANYHSRSGWGVASRNYLRALLTIDELDIAIRPIYPDNSLVEYLDFDLLELQNKTAARYDYLIQKVLPFYITYNAQCGQNILLTVTETNDLKHYGLTSKLNSLDSILVPDSVGKRNLEKLTDTPVYSISEAISPCETSERHASVLKHTFNFYTIGEYSDRKNIKLLIRAYLQEFSKFDSVNLVIKTHKSGQRAHETITEITEQISILKKHTLRKYINLDLHAPIQLILEQVPDIYTIHNACHCYVLTSRGESFNIGSAEALMVGNPVIVTNNIGTCDYINSNNGYIVESKRVPCETKNPPLQDYYTCDETWYEPSIMSLRQQMRVAYNEYRLDKFADKKDSIKTAAGQFAYENIGNKIAETLKI